MLFMGGAYGDPAPIIPWFMLGYPGGLEEKEILKHLTKLKYLKWYE